MLVNILTMMMEVVMEIRVCIGSSCHIKGSKKLLKELDNLIKINHLNNIVSLRPSFCLGNCQMPGISIQFDECLYSIKLEDVESFFNDVILPEFILDDAK